MAIPAIKDVSTVLRLLLSDGATNKFPQATIYDSAGAQVGGVLNLTHVANGLYSVATTFTTLGDFDVVYITFNEAAHTSESKRHARANDRFRVTLTVEDEVWDTIIANHLAAGSTGAALDSAGGVAPQVEEVKQAWVRQADFNFRGTIWLLQSGQRTTLVSPNQVDIDARVDGVSLFTLSSTVPDAQGRFRLTTSVPPVISAGTIVDIDAAITVGANTFKSQTSIQIPKLSA